MGWAEYGVTPTSSSTLTYSVTAVTNGTVVVFVNQPSTRTNRTAEVAVKAFTKLLKKPKYRPPLPVEKKMQPPKAYKARHGFQQMARVPNYRGARVR